MSVIVKNMAMPKNCFECPCCTLGYCRVDVKTTEYAKYVFSDGQDGRHPDCPLVEIPTPHGRLIDADAVNKAMDERIKKLKDDKSIYEASCVSTALDMFAPTVIEAEGREE